MTLPIRSLTSHAPRTRFATTNLTDPPSAIGINSEPFIHRAQ